MKTSWREEIKITWACYKNDVAFYYVWALVFVTPFLNLILRLTFPELDKATRFLILSPMMVPLYVMLFCKGDK